ncbi:MAG: competence/damage-inducible protein A [Bacillota bacterium]|nr:competence/damage-inducible protein A [Bacillota bacterium]
MNAEIISVGTELLMGQTLNTDAQYLAQKLSELGINLYYQTTVGDNPGRLKQTFLHAFSRSDVVITTGGLGPTEDDLTKETIADALGIKMVLHEESRRRIKEFFGKTGLVPPVSNFKQAVMPAGAVVIKNDQGTAPGCIIEKDGKSIVILPGPPRELIPMFEADVMPYLDARSGRVIASRVLHIFGLGESLIEERIIDIVQAQTNPTIAPYAALTEVALRITASCRKGEDPRPLIRPVEEEIRSRLGDHVYGADDDTMEKVAARLLIEKRMKLAVAESCTGGMVTSRLVDVPGISASLVCGIVAYDDSVKTGLLGVPEAVIREYGAVSAETAEAMAKGALKICTADISLATTGIAGPSGGTAEKPVGLVYCGLATGYGIFVKQLQFSGDREKIRMRASMYVLDMLRRELLGIRQL